MAEKMTGKAAFIDAEIAKLFPDAACELRYGSQIDLLVAVMLSAQTTDVAVNATTPDLFSRFREAKDYADAPEGAIEACIRRLGLYRSKAKNIRAAMKIVAATGGTIPNDQAFLERLPGVGRKTANVFLAEWYHVPRIAVDTHVSRVAFRLGFAPAGDTPEKTERRLMEAFPEDKWITLHHRFIFFGRYFCTARKPACQTCPLLAVCVEPQRG